MRPTTDRPSPADGLEDLSFLVPFACDCSQRLSNLRAVTAWIRRHFHGPVLVGGEDLDRAADALGDSDVTFVPVGRSTDRQWRPSIVRNALADAAGTERVAVWDVDVWCVPAQVRAAVGLLRRGDADFVYPYDGTFVHVEPAAAEAVATGLDRPTPGHSVVVHPGRSVGGAVLFDRATYRKGGAENTEMINWGPDDRERYARFRRLGYRVARVDGPLYHLDHDRPHERYYGHPDFVANVHRLGFGGGVNEASLFDEPCPVCRTGDPTGR